MLFRSLRLEELYAQIVGLLCGILKASFRACMSLLHLFYFIIQAIKILFEIASGLLGDIAGLSLPMQVLTSLLGPFLSNKNLLSDLRPEGNKDPVKTRREKGT